MGTGKEGREKQRDDKREGQAHAHKLVTRIKQHEKKEEKVNEK